MPIRNALADSATKISGIGLKDQSVRVRAVRRVSKRFTERFSEFSEFSDTLRRALK